MILASVLLLGADVALAAPGSLDPGFGEDGLVTVRPRKLYDSPGASPNAILQQSNGMIVVVGQGSVFSPYLFHEFAVVRLRGDGVPDSAFGTGGIAGVAFPRPRPAVPYAAIQQADGKLVLAGHARKDGSNYDLALARLNSDGTIDPGFGDLGIVMLDLGGRDEAVTGLVQQPGGRLVVAGYSNASGVRRAVIAGINPDGSLNSAFGTGGTTWIDDGAGSESWIHALASQPDGRLVAAGGFRQAAVPQRGTDMLLLRFAASGNPDPGFAGDGMLDVDFGKSDDLARSIAVQPDGAIVAAGFTTPPGSYSRIALLRVLENGDLDVAFGSGGASVIDLGADAHVNALVAQADGKLAATGRLARMPVDGSEDAFVARIDFAGALDTSFGNRGLALADFGSLFCSTSSAGQAMLQQEDGKLVVAAATHGDFGVARFDDDSSYPGRIGLTQVCKSADEEAMPAVTFRVRRTGGRIGPVSVRYETASSDGPYPAQPGADFVGASGTLEWHDGESEDHSITVDLINDTEVEEKEWFYLQLSAPSGGARLASSRTVVDVASGDSGPDSGQLELLWPRDPTHRVPESIGTISLPVTRTGGLAGEISVQYRANAGGSAIPGSDFTAVSGTLTWTDSDAAIKHIKIAIIDDVNNEEVESFEIQILNPTGGATIAGPDRQLIYIDDNDPPAGGGGGGGTGGGGTGGGGGGGGGGGSLDVATAAALLYLLLLTCARLRTTQTGSGRRNRCDLLTGPRLNTDRSHGPRLDCSGLVLVGFKPWMT